MSDTLAAAVLDARRKQYAEAEDPAHPRLDPADGSWFRMLGPALEVRVRFDCGREQWQLMVRGEVSAREVRPGALTLREALDEATQLAARAIEREGRLVQLWQSLAVGVAETWRQNRRPCTG